MGRLDDVTLEELQELRKQTAGEIPRERVLAAIGRKQGETLETLAERHDGVEKPIRNWLDRFDEEPIEQAPHDAPRSGRPPTLDAEQREHLFAQLQQPPTSATTTKRGRRRCCSTTFTRKTALRTVKDTLASA